MSHSVPRCATCGADLALELDPRCTTDIRARVLPADPPFRFVCRTPGCQRPVT